MHIHTDGAGKFVVGDHRLDPAARVRQVQGERAGGRRSSAAQVIHELAPGLHLVNGGSEELAACAVVDGAGRGDRRRTDRPGWLCREAGSSKLHY
ncbi:hypothetical protein KNE206_73550 [Kitasatospora sp. NE20-6]|uniref:hypothetical protein n=1 Tax=Kitasatospora sp. NE20-6 TaxID=2859066 RepID=UPI0034DBBBA5